MQKHAPPRWRRAAPASGPRRPRFGTVGTALLVLLFFCLSAVPARTAPLSDDDGKRADAALDAAEHGKWTAARHQAKKVSDPVVAKFIRWLDLTRSDGNPDFEDLADFIVENPHWPRQWRLRDKAEAKLPVGKNPDEVLNWFEAHPPVSTEGRIRRIAALFAKGRDEEGRATVRETWINQDFTKQQDRAFYKHYRKYLTREDHHARLERLIWDERYWAARRMFSKVDAGIRALAEARLMLMRRMGGVDRAIAKVPDTLKNDPGLVYERLRWRRRKGRYDSAVELFDAAPGDPIRPDKWWIERQFLAREALADGFISEAYRIASQHGLKPDDGNTWQFSEAEWLSGWIALRFLNDDRVAMDHFVAMYQSVSYPISRARGAYWSARAAEALDIPHLAKLWYGIAAKLTTTYYGQLAALKLAPERRIKLPGSPLPTTEQAEAFEDYELVHVIRMLHQIGASDRIDPFLSVLAEKFDSPGWQVLTANLAAETGRHDLAIRTAKEAGYEGHNLIREGFPLVALPKPEGDNGTLLEEALALSVIRQESGFWHGAISSAGARGMMQVMPATAKRVSKILNIRYSRDRLLKDPDYNLTLGQAYLASLIDRFDGSYILALAAYNAGPARVNRWIEEYGNPRQSSVDTIDWIETIPFRETRNYIQRVMENLQVYRFRLASTETALALERDLER